jgi:CheY-like chemotaxis protein
MPTILLIDDHMDLLTIIDEVLEYEGFQVFKAGNAADGIALAQERLPDIILCDMMMPDQSGRAVRDYLRTRPETARIPIAFISANAEMPHEDGERWLIKPFSMEDVLKLVHEIMSGSQ